MARYTKPMFSYPLKDVIAAACVAQRVNGEYLKMDKNIYENGSEYVGYGDNPLIETKIANKTIMYQILNDDIQQIQDEDREQVKKIISLYNGLSFKIISGKHISDFDHVVLAVLQKEQITSSLDIAVLASLPKSYERLMIRENADSRIAFTSGYVGKVGDKVECKIEVIKCVFSHNFGIYFVTGITENNQSVFFSYKEKLETGTNVIAVGRIKAHKENSSQLTRTKVL